MKVSVIIPVYNEKDTIQEIVEKVKGVDLEKEIIIVDDGSTDGTSQVLNEMDGDDLKIFHHEKNLGKGAALRTGFSHARGDILITQDADLEYDPAEYSILLDPILRRAADVVYGSRLSGGRPQRVHLFWHKLGNDFLTFVTNLLYNTTLTDMETGYKVFRRGVIQEMLLRSNDFCIEPEITAKVFKRKYRVYEVPVSYYGRTYEEGKKIHWWDGFKALWTLMKYRIVD